VPTPPTLQVPHVKAAIAANRPVIIVALGSSSTQGWMASNTAHTYPAILQHLLNAGLPTAHIAVINRGIGGQDATEELARLEQDAIAVQPQLVIWQVGANGAIANVDPAVFKRLLTTGVTRLHKAGIDVILMDNQRSPRVLAAPEHTLIDQLLAEVAADTGAGLFSRSALMDAWQKAGRPYEEFVARDNMHQNDLGYACVAAALDQAILAGLLPQKTAAADQKARGSAP
jgi:lysophospholipase L1-like esterase